MGKAIILSRVSTLQQDLKQQTDEVFKFVLNEGYTPEDIEVIEDKESAVKLTEEQRLGLIEMKKKILERPGTYDTVFAYEISRIGRRAEVNYAIRNFLMDNKVQLVILKPYIRLFNADFKIDETANMTFAIFNALAENEGYIRKERFARGRTRLQKQGKYVGGRLPRGYKTDDKNNIIIDPKQAEFIKELYIRYAETEVSLAMLAKELIETGDIVANSLDSGVGILRQILRDKAYTGQKTQYKTKTGIREAGNIYPLIISKDIFEKAQVKLDEGRKKFKKTHKRIHICSGLVKDKDTGYVLSGKPCIAAYELRRRYLDKNYTMTVPMNIIDSLAWYVTKKMNEMNGPTKLQEKLKETSKNYQINEKKIENYKQKRFKLYKKELKINERLVEGKMKENIADKILEDIYTEQKIYDEMILKISEEMKYQYDFMRKVIQKTYVTLDIDKITDEKEIRKYIQETISEIIVNKFDKETKSKRRDRMTGTISFSFKTGLSDMFYFQSYTKKVYDKNMDEVDYGYTERTIAMNRVKKVENNI